MEKRIFLKGSVGKGGTNIPADVRWVQFILNLIPGSAGGPRVPLAVDGITGPKTIGAIQTFQFTQFQFHDGRVDPAGKTQYALFNTARIHQPQALTLHRPQTLVSIHASEWRFRSGSTLSASLIVAGGVRGRFIADNDVQRRSLEIEFIGGGGAVGVLPAGFTFSTPQMPGTASPFYKGRNKQLAPGGDPFFSVGLMVSGAGAQFCGGGGITAMFFGLKPQVTSLVTGALSALHPAAYITTLITLLDQLSQCSVFGAQIGACTGLDAGMSLFLLDLRKRSVPYSP